MTQQGPNIIELYEAAVQQMLPTLGAVTADQLTNATPCVEWNVQNLSCKLALAGTDTSGPMGLIPLNSIWRIPSIWGAKA